MEQTYIYIILLSIITIVGIYIAYRMLICRKQGCAAKDNERSLRREATQNKNADNAQDHNDTHVHIDEDDPEEEKLIRGIVRYGEKAVNEVMTPRLDATTLNTKDDYATVLKTFVDNKYSRIPVLDESEEQVEGILYSKDLLPHIITGKPFVWQDFMRKPFFVPETKMIDDLLREFQRQKVHIAIVVDEFGTMSGIVTMEDILEEIVGEINDEFDEEEWRFVKVDEYTYIFEGKTPIDDFCDILQLDPHNFVGEKCQAETLAGFVLELIDDFPVPHQKAQHKQIKFEVLRMDERRISKIRVITQAEDASTPKP